MDWRLTLRYQLNVDKLPFANKELETSIDGWYQENTGSDIAFTWNNPSSARASGSAANTTGIGMSRPDNGGRWKPGTYKFMLDVSNQSTGGSEPLSSFLTVYGSITGSSLDDDITYSGDSGIWAVSTSDEREIEFTLTKEYEKLFFKWDKSGSDSGYNVDIIIHSIKLVSIEDVFDEHEITEPDGWKETRIVLERHPEFFSLIETLTANYVFYGTDDRGIDGGYHFIKRVEENYGIDEQLSIRIEFDPDDTGDYETVFEGLLDIAGSTTLPDNKIQVPLVRDD